ncbi:MAG TPA: phage holin family protein [Gemmatimonadaceae bacterium]
MAATRDGERRSIGTLLLDLANGSAQLVHDKLRLARTELAELARGAGIGTGLVALGGVLAILGAMAIVIGLILLAGDQWFPNNRYWIAALLAMALFLVLAGWMAARGLDLLSPARLAPDQTVTTLKEDTQWLKRQLTSDATSS